MSEDMIVKHCSPTLAGIKTGSLFSCPYKSREELLNDIRRFNGLLVPKGLRVLPLRYSDDHALIYVFRPSGLKADLADDAARKILVDAGYRSEVSDQCILELIHRLNARESFPHEIGLFLSYPPEDVRGFIENCARNCKCVGCWKVYGDETAAKRQFERFQRCTEVYCKQWAMGASVEELTVAV